MENVTTETDLALVARLSDILAGVSPISEGSNLIAEDVFMHMDGYDFRGIDTWRTWLRFIRSRARVTELTLVDRRIVSEGNRVRLTGRWQGYYRDRLAFSNPGTASYRIVDGKIVEIWTTRTNYPFMLGGWMNSHAGMLLVLAYLFFWSSFYQPLVDWDNRLPARKVVDSLAAG